MIRFERPDPPSWMTEEWQRERGEKLAKNEKPFRWPTVDKLRVNLHLVPILKSASANHCAYCDGHPLGTQSRETIDHFRPKETFQELAFTWSNLFLCCDVCQQSKSSKFSESWLKPDETDYDFEDHFFCDIASGRLVPLTERAEKTISAFDLNNPELTTDRIHRRRDYLNASDEDDRILNDFPYRFFVDA